MGVGLGGEQGNRVSWWGEVTELCQRWCWHISAAQGAGPGIWVGS